MGPHTMRQRPGFVVLILAGRCTMRCACGYLMVVWTYRLGGVGQRGVFVVCLCVYVCVGGCWRGLCFLLLVSQARSHCRYHAQHKTLTTCGCMYCKHAQGGGSRTSATDVICPMYARPRQLVELAQAAEAAGDPRPVMLCEYAHSMGNRCTESQSLLRRVVGGAEETFW